MSLASTLLGAVLTFGTVDGQTLQLTVSLTKSATVALTWGERTFSSPEAKEIHGFGGLPAPQTEALTYTLRVAKEAPRSFTVKPFGGTDPLLVAVYGDSRDGAGPHRAIVQAMTRADPHVVVHTGDVIHRANDVDGWTRHLATTLPLLARVPVVFALGNHELYGDPSGGERQAMHRIPPPQDPLAKTHGVAPSTFHVRVRDLLFVSLNSNTSMEQGSPQMNFLERVLQSPHGAKHVLFALHHGPRSSGMHGGHPQGQVLVDLAKRHKVTGILSGHDHLYERIVQDGVTYVVSGGGGAPLYQRGGVTRGSQVFVSTYNWVMLRSSGGALSLRAYGLEGSVIDDAAMAPPPTFEAPKKKNSLVGLGLSACVLAIAFFFVVFRLLRNPRHA